MNWLSIIHSINKIKIFWKFGNYILVNVVEDSILQQYRSCTVHVDLRQADVMNDVMKDSGGTFNADWVPHFCSCYVSTFLNSRLLGIKCSVSCPGLFQCLWHCLLLVVWTEFCLHQVVFFLLALRRAIYLPFSHSSIYASLHQYLHSYSR